MALPDRITRPRRGLRGRWRLRRRLAGIAKGLAKDATFAAKFAMFNALTKGEPASRRRTAAAARRATAAATVRLAADTPRRQEAAAGNRPARNGPGRKRVAWQGRVVAIAAMAAVIVGTLLLSSLLRPAARPCLMLASSGTQASASAAPSNASQPGRRHRVRRARRRLRQRTRVDLSRVSC